MKYETQKTIIANWRNISGGIGGRETILAKLSKLLNGREISYLYATSVLNCGSLSNPFTPVYQGREIDRYLQLHERLFDIKLIIKNSGIGGYLKLKTPVVSIFQDPYYSLFKIVYTIYSQCQESMEHYNSSINLQKKESELSELNIAVSNFMKKEMEETGIRCDKVIPETTDYDKFKILEENKIKRIKRKFGIPLDKTIGLYVGKFIPQEGWETIAKLVKDFKDIFWVIVLTVNADIRPRLPNVKILQEINGNLMPEVYNCADFVVNPSWVESFSLASLEACACNKPIIMTNTGFAWDWWDNRIGIRVKDYKDYEGYKNAVEDMLHNFKYNIQYNPRKVIMQKFPENNFNNAWKKIARRYDAL